MVPVRAGLATYKGGKQAESVPNPSKGERVCFVPYLIRGLGFPIHPFLRGLLEFYGLQLHHLTPASILHTARKMGLDAQEQLTKSYKARDVQNGGRG